MIQLYNHWHGYIITDYKADTLAWYLLSLHPGSDKSHQGTKCQGRVPGAMRNLKRIYFCLQLLHNCSTIAPSQWQFVVAVKQFQWLHSPQSLQTAAKTGNSDCLAAGKLCNDHLQRVAGCVTRVTGCQEWTTSSIQESGDSGCCYQHHGHHLYCCAVVLLYFSCVLSNVAGCGDETFLKVCKSTAFYILKLHCNISRFFLILFFCCIGPFLLSHFNKHPHSKLRVPYFQSCV